jgi:S-adenosylmethionine hydrolase
VIHPEWPSGAECQPSGAESQPSGAEWQPSGIVTLTTDFGLADPYVGTMKGVILSRFRAAVIVDVTHGVAPQSVRAGAFFLRGAAAYFPPGTVHVAVVDPGVGTARRLCVARHAGQCFLAPDNGLLPAALGPEARLLELDATHFALPDASSTFHGRDVLAPAAAAIAGGLAPEAASVRALVDPVRLAHAAAQRSTDGRAIEAEVLIVDHFGNVVLDLVRADLAGPLEDWCVVHRGQTIAFARTYALVDPGKALALVDSWGAVEIAVRDGDAAAVLGLSPGDRLTLRRQP